MTTTRIWNVSDDPKTEAKSQSLLLFGKLVPPGRFVEVDEADLVNAHKLKKQQELGHVYVGKQLPPKYLKSMNPPRAKLPEGIARAHGKAPVDVIAAEGQVKVDEVLTEKKTKSPKVPVAQHATKVEAKPEEKPVLATESLPVIGSDRPFSSDKMKVSVEAVLQKK